MYLDGVALDKHWAKCLNRLTVQRWSTVQKYILVLDCFFENRPDLRRFVFNETSRTANVVGEFACEQALNDKGAEEFENHVLRKTALIEREIWPDDNDGAARIADALTQ